jgi:hypothetical protein
MENRRNHRVQVAIAALAAALVMLWEVPAAAQHSDDDRFRWAPTITVKTHPGAVVVDSEVHRSVPGEADTHASGSHCWLENTTTIGEIRWPDPSAYPTVKVFPFFVICDGHVRGIEWVGWQPSEQRRWPGNAQGPQEIARRLRDEIPIPNVKIEMNPQPGLVGIESWFWIEGFEGSPIEHSTDAFGRLVEVEASVLRYEWSFGDGSRFVARTVGDPYPARSDVRHVYERSSLGHPGGYSVQVAFVFSVRYRVDGGKWIDLPGITRVTQARYPVQESQAVIGR